MNKPSAVLCYVKCRESFIVILYFVDISEKRKKTKKQKKGQVYKSGDLVALSMVDCDSMEAGSIETILVKDNQVYFICKVHICNRNRLQYFESQSCDSSYRFVHFKSLADYKPLVKRGISLKFVLVVLHRISFQYK